MFYVWWPFVTWSWPWTELNIKHLLNQCLALYFRSTRSKFWLKTDNFEVSTASNLKAPILTFDLTRDLIWKIYGVLIVVSSNRLFESFRTPHRSSLCGHSLASYDVGALTPPPPSLSKSRVAKYPSKCRVKTLVMQGQGSQLVMYWHQSHQLSPFKSIALLQVALTISLKSCRRLFPLWRHNFVTWPDLTTFFHQRLRKWCLISYGKFQHDTPNSPSVQASSSEKKLMGVASTPSPSTGEGRKFLICIGIPLFRAFDRRLACLAAPISSGVRQGDRICSPSGSRSAEYPSGARVKGKVSA